MKEEMKKFIRNKIKETEDRLRDMDMVEEAMPRMNEKGYLRALNDMLKHIGGKR